MLTRRGKLSDAGTIASSTTWRTTRKIGLDDLLSPEVCDLIDLVRSDVRYLDDLLRPEV